MDKRQLRVWAWLQGRSRPDWAALNMVQCSHNTLMKLPHQFQFMRSVPCMWLRETAACWRLAVTLRSVHGNKGLMNTRCPRVSEWGWRVDVVLCMSYGNIVCRPLWRLSRTQKQNKAAFKTAPQQSACTTKPRWDLIIKVRIPAAGHRLNMTCARQH